ncbi:hypothetical protein J8983_00780 [Klebsiella pneumoniae]|uniref:hypothetical protein n=1 Tax=Klebsiella pneumoniae TaxID=573 RepID=UPI002F960CF5|nr:hypothetical protein [Klebsiella pneumoniae]HBZ7325518.1 hypothetical protein [Klebsiella pneumoniae]HBZ7354090.1 hypothetical protein [Klebsiella pneumoniae]HBZ7940091.1 hypothetical protein [Klebsiella pneumoniae]
MILYKYMEKKWADEFLKTGSLRVGTLYDFRKADHKPGVSDDQEGFAYSVFDVAEGKTFADMSEVERANCGLGTIIPYSLLGDLSQGGIGPNSNMQFIRTSTDMYVMCFSMSPNRSAMLKMGYDTCLKINNAEIFINQLTRKLRTRARMLYIAQQVDYSGKETSYSVVDCRYPFMTKHADFAYQDEFRAVWKRRDYAPQPSPHIVFIPSAIKHCEIIEPI